MEFFKQIKKYADKMPAFIMLFVFPTDKVIAVYFSFSTAILKYLSTQRAGFATQLYEYYFKYVLDAKRKKESISIVPKIDILGDVIEFAQLSQKLSLIMAFINYFLLPILIPIGLYFLLKNNVILVMQISNFIVTYYFFVWMYSIYRIFTTNLKQSTLKIFLFSELNYIFAKTSEIDEEVAKIAMQQIKASVLLENEKVLKPRQTELKQILGVK